MNHLTDLTVDQWTVAVAVVAAVIAVWQAAIARRSAAQQLALAERIHREQNEPYVIVDIQPERNDGSLLLVIENAGPTVARNVRISCNPPLETGWAPMGDEPDLTQVIQQVLARTIPVLPPRRRLTFTADIGVLSVEQLQAGPAADAPSAAHQGRRTLSARSDTDVPQPPRAPAFASQKRPQCRLTSARAEST
ncbi:MULTISPECIES: hypothetical protein [unclassified Streptomyces]|uniref:hypothetical protein n=1 Tax=unclassified Streptomyces TaxID=2593676 RepID=UPI003394CEB5